MNPRDIIHEWVENSNFANFKYKVATYPTEQLQEVFEGLIELKEKCVEDLRATLPDEYKDAEEIYIRLNDRNWSREIGVKVDGKICKLYWDSYWKKL